MPYMYCREYSIRLLFGISTPATRAACTLSGVLCLETCKIADHGEGERAIFEVTAWTLTCAQNERSEVTGSGSERRPANLCTCGHAP